MWECQALGAADTERQEQKRAESEMAQPRAPQGDDGRAMSKLPPHLPRPATVLSAPTVHPQCPSTCQGSLAFCRQSSSLPWS